MVRLKIIRFGLPWRVSLMQIAVIPLHDAVQGFAVFQRHHHRSAGLHLLDPIEIFGMRDFRRSGLLARGRAGVVILMHDAGWERFLYVRKNRGETYDDSP